MRTQRGLGELIIGIGLVIAGVLFLLSTFDVLEDVDWWRWLPILLVVWGVVQFIGSRGRDYIGSGILVVVGIGLLLATTGVIRWGTFGNLWPVVLVLIGLSILLGRRQTSPPAGAAHAADVVSIVAAFGGSSRTMTSQAFRGGEITSLLGGANVDLRDARLADNASLHVRVILGGIDLRVPDEWEIDSSAAVILGGLDDQRRNRRLAEGPPPVLRITGLILLGGLTIKS